ncbi:MAG TPA: hypothetical protein VEU33_32180 [Archangium sp.]|nr:hypothetical protein [Archangium sp.]
MSTSDDRCAHHSRVAAVVTCMTCNQRVCRHCIDVESGADSCRPCVAARSPAAQPAPRQPGTAVAQRPARRSEPLEEQRPTRRPEAAGEHEPKDRSSTAVILGWFGLLVGGLSALSPVVKIMPIPLALFSPLVMLVLGNRAWVMAGRDLEDLREGRLPPELKGRITHARVLGGINVLAGLLSCTLMAGVIWFFVNLFSTGVWR